MTFDKVLHTGKVVLPNAMIFFYLYKKCVQTLFLIYMNKIYREIESAVNYFQITFTTPLQSFKSEWIIYFSYTKSIYLRPEIDEAHPTNLQNNIFRR